MPDKKIPQSTQKALGVPCEETPGKSMAGVLHNRQASLCSILYAQKPMARGVASDFRPVIAERIAGASQMLASRWLDELKNLVPVDQQLGTSGLGLLLGLSIVADGVEALIGSKPNHL
jgi:hypothetical protein